MTFRTNGTTATFDQNENDYNTIVNVTAQLNSKMRLKGTVNLQSMKDVPGPDRQRRRFPDHRAGRHQHVEPDALPEPDLSRHVRQLLRRRARLGGEPEAVRQRDASALYDYGTHGGGAGEALRHTFGTSNIQSASFNFPEIPDSLRFVSGYADLPSSSVTKYDDFKRHAVNADLSYFANKWGQHSIKAGFQYERIGNSRLGGAQFPTINLQLGLAAQRARRPQRARHLRPLHGDAGLQLRRHPHQRPRRVPAGRVDRASRTSRSISACAPTRKRFRRTPRAIAASSSASRTRSRRAPDSRGTSSATRKWKGYGSFGIFYDTSKLEMPRGLFGSEHSVTYYMTLDTFNWQSIQCGHPPVPGPNCPGTYIEQVDFRHAANEEDNFLIDPNAQADSHARIHASASITSSTRGWRSACAIRASGSIAPSKTPACWCPASARCSASPIPASGIGENVLRDFAGCTDVPEPAEADPQLRRRRVPLPEAVQQQLADDDDVSLQPAVWQLLRPDQLGREQPQLAERQPVLRRPVLLVRSHRPAGVRARCRPIARTCSRSKASTTRRGARASASTGSPRAARRCRRR